MTDTTELKRDAQTMASDLGQKAKVAARAEARDQVEAARDATAAKVEHFAQAAETAAGQFDPSSVQAQAVMQIADRIDGFANTLRSADPVASVQGVARFARQNPALFVAGAALVGFAATRFLKARDPHAKLNAAANDDPWNSQQARAAGELNGDPSHGA